MHLHPPPSTIPLLPTACAPITPHTSVHAGSGSSVLSSVTRHPRILPRFHHTLLPASPLFQRPLCTCWHRAPICGLKPCAPIPPFPGRTRRPSASSCCSLASNAQAGWPEWSAHGRYFLSPASVGPASVGLPLQILIRGTGIPSGLLVHPPGLFWRSLLSYQSPLPSPQVAEGEIENPTL